jgi:hypothetical protein
MESHHDETKPTQEVPAGEPPGLPQATESVGAEPASPVLDLIRQVLDLLKGDKDPVRLNELLAALEAAQRVQMDKCLARKRDQDLDVLFELIETRAQLHRRFRAATRRTDLTLREAVFFCRLSSQVLRQQQAWLLAEKRRLEQSPRRAPASGEVGSKRANPPPAPPRVPPE